MATRRGAPRRAGGRNAFIICLAVLTAAAVTAAVFLLLDGGGREDFAAYVQEGFDAAACAGALEDVPAGPLGDLDAAGYRINTKIVVEKGKAGLRIENPVENRQLMKVVLTLDDGTVVYTTDFIKPYYSIESDKLDVSLKKGAYAGTAKITFYDRVTREEQSGTEVAVQLDVR